MHQSFSLANNERTVSQLCLCRQGGLDWRLFQNMCGQLWTWCVNCDVNTIFFASLRLWRGGDFNTFLVHR